MAWFKPQASRITSLFSIPTKNKIFISFESQDAKILDEANGNADSTIAGSGNLDSVAIGSSTSGLGVLGNVAILFDFSDLSAVTYTTIDTFGVATNVLTRPLGLMLSNKLAYAASFKEAAFASTANLWIYDTTLSTKTTLDKRTDIVKTIGIDNFEKYLVLTGIPLKEIYDLTQMANDPLTSPTIAGERCVHLTYQNK